MSPESVAEVEETIADRRPDVVAVELDEGRYRQLKGDAPDDLDASDLLHGNTVFQFLAYWMLSYVQTKMGERFDIEPGADMMAAVETAEDHGIDVALVDRDIQVTIQRFWNRLTGFEKAKLLGGLIGGMAGALTGAFVVGAMVGMFVATGATLLGGPYVVPAGVAGSVPVAAASSSRHWTGCWSRAVSRWSSARRWRSGSNGWSASRPTATARSSTWRTSPTPTW
ncbi:hypothetical protein GJ629_08720 [Halapricum sp. CBA1109]|nr:hypothetical protein [Halapricum sp. CBA1109]